MKTGYFKMITAMLLTLGVSLIFGQDKPQPLSADYTFTLKDGSSKPGTGKIYFSWPYVRMDSDGGTITITNYATNTEYFLFTEGHKYLEKRAPEYLLDGETPCAKRPDITCKKIGAQTVNGRICDMWETTDKSGHSGSICMDQKLKFPVRVQNANGATVDYTNIKAEPQPASLFEIPAGYSKTINPFDPNVRPDNNLPQPFTPPDGKCRLSEEKRDC